MKLRDARNCGGRWLNIFVFTVAILFTVIYFLTPLYGDGFLSAPINHRRDLKLS